MSGFLPLYNKNDYSVQFAHGLYLYRMILLCIGSISDMLWPENDKERAKFGVSEQYREHQIINSRTTYV